MKPLPLRCTICLQPPRCKEASFWQPDFAPRIELELQGLNLYPRGNFYPIVPPPRDEHSPMFRNTEVQTETLHPQGVTLPLRDFTLESKSKVNTSPIGENSYNLVWAEAQPNYFSHFCWPTTADIDCVRAQQGDQIRPLVDCLLWPIILRLQK
jgi:hypothetical protein